MKSIGEFIKWFIYITIGIFLVCAISFTLEGATEMPVNTFWKVLLEGLVATVVTVPLQPGEDDGVGRGWAKFILHYLSLCIIMCGFGIWFGWIRYSVVGILVMAVDVAIVYALCTTIYYLVDVRQAKGINKVLQEKYGEEEE